MRTILEAVDAALVILLARLIGSWDNHGAQLKSIGQLAVARRERLIFNRLFETVQLVSRRLNAGPAVLLAALFEGRDPGTLSRYARNRFRCVSWEALSPRQDLLDTILSAGTINGGKEAAAEAFALTKHCDLGECNAFVSHSWHDNAALKWVLLRQWCEGFHVRSHR